MTLLVGASGVGKTQILDAIMPLKKIANGHPFSGVVRVVDVETVSRQNYV